MATKAEIQEELDRVKAEHEAFRKRVVEVTRDYAEAHGWCNVVDEALRDLDLIGPPRRRITVTVEVDGDEHGVTDSDGDESWAEIITGSLPWDVSVEEYKVEAVA